MNEIQHQIPETPGLTARLFRYENLLLILLMAALILATGLLYNLVTAPPAGEGFTEFYFTGPDGIAGNYPRSIAPGGEGVVLIGVANHEYKPMCYRIQVRTGDYTAKELHPLKLEHGEKWESALSYSAGGAQKDLLVGFLLYRENDREPYRELHLRMDVVESE